MTRRIAALRIFIFLGMLGFLFLAGSFAKKKPPEKPININTASSEELQQVPGIGPVTAEKIVRMRKTYGAFKSVDDLLAVRGLGAKRLEKMRKYLTVGRASAPKADATPSKAPPDVPSRSSDKPAEKP